MKQTRISSHLVLRNDDLTRLCIISIGNGMVEDANSTYNLHIHVSNRVRRQRIGREGRERGQGRKRGSEKEREGEKRRGRERIAGRGKGKERRRQRMEQSVIRVWTKLLIFSTFQMNCYKFQIPYGINSSSG